jgi:hypothetical protein
MAVLIEGISVVVRRVAISEAFQGGWDEFVANVPNATLCADTHLARIGFMTPRDVEFFVRLLQKNGLRFVEDGRPRDIIVVDQTTGPTTPCEWIEYGHIDLAPGQQVAATRMVGDSTKQLICPDGWKFENSLSARPGFIRNEDVPTRLTFLRHDDGLDVFLDRETGKEVYVGRTGTGPGARADS